MRTQLSTFGGVNGIFLTCLRTVHNQQGISCDPGPEPPPSILLTSSHIHEAEAQYLAYAAAPVISYAIMIFVNLVGTMSFIVWRLMMMDSTIPSTSSQLTLFNVSLATTVYFTCTVTRWNFLIRDLPVFICKEPPPDAAGAVPTEVHLNPHHVVLVFMWTTAVFTYVKLLALLENARACEVYHQLHHVPEVKAAPAVSHYAAGVVPAAHFSKLSPSNPLLFHIQFPHLPPHEVDPEPPGGDQVGHGVEPVLSKLAPV